MLSRRSFIKTGLIFIPTWYHTKGLGGSVSLSSLDNEVYNWMSRVINGGSNYTSISVVAQDYGMKRLRDFGLRSSILRLNWFSGLNTTAALIPLINDVGGSVDITRVGGGGTTGAPSDWTYNETGSSGGLKALTANTFIDPVFASNNFTSINNVGISIYVRDTTIEESFLAGSNTFGSSSQFYLTAGYTGGNTRYSAFTPDFFVADSNAIGLYTAVRTASSGANAAVIYKNGSSIISTSSPGGATNATSIGIFAWLSSVGSNSEFCTKSFGGYSFHGGLTSQQAANFNIVWKEVQTIFNRQVI